MGLGLWCGNAFGVWTLNVVKDGLEDAYVVWLDDCLR